jgi:flagellin
MRINHNIAALNTYRQLAINNANGSKAIEKLSSGLRINRAGDDAAGLAISEKMRGQIRGLEMASKNAQDGVSLIQTAEGALNETHSILQRMRELAVQAANDTNNTTDRQQLQEEVNALIEEIDRIGNATEFNNMKLLNGDLSGAKKLTGSETSEYIQSFVASDLGSLADGTEISLEQQITFETIEGGEDDNTYNFQTITFEVSAGGATPQTVSFSAGELGDGTITKEVQLEDAKFQVTVDKDALLDLVDKSADDITGLTGQSEVGSYTVEATSGITFHIGANQDQNLQMTISDVTAEALNVNAIDITTQANADAAIETIQAAIDEVSTQRSKLGAAQNRLEHTIANLGTAAENLTAAESRIRDVDMAKEIMEFTKTSILTQAAQAMLAQANQQPQGVLQLLR